MISGFWQCRQSTSLAFPAARSCASSDVCKSFRGLKGSTNCYAITQIRGHVGDYIGEYYERCQGDFVRMLSGSGLRGLVMLGGSVPLSPKGSGLRGLPTEH